MSQASRDQNNVPTLLAASNVDGITPVRVYADPVTHRLLVDLPSSGGTVTSVSVVSANGLAGTVATATTTPAITLSTTVSGILQGNGTAISAITVGSGLSFVAGTLSATGSGITIGTTTITSGTTTRILYDNAGVVGEYTINGSGTAVAMATSPSFTTPALGVATGTSLALGGATIGTNAIAVTGTALFSSSLNAGGGSFNVNSGGTITSCPGGTFSNIWLNGTNVTTVPAGVIGFVPVNWFDSPDTAISRTAAGKMAIGNGTAGDITGTLSVASIELGAATDTTLSRSSAGVLAVEGVVIPSISSTNTLTNKRITRRLTTTNAPGATPSTNSDNVDVMNFTGLAAAITSMSTNLSGTPVDGQLLEFRFTDNGTARAITWGASFGATTIALPTTTVISTMLRVLFEYNGSIWQCIATA